MDSIRRSVPGVRSEAKNFSFGVKGYLDAGYAFARFEGTYFAQIAGFHSRVHKHADHLSFCWADRGLPILTDPGKFAYEYTDPKRRFAESSRAHNTIDIDGMELPRRGVKAPGSMLKYAGEQSGLVVTYSSTTHGKDIPHDRAVLLSPSKFLLVIDWINDLKRRKHTFRHLDGGCIHAEAAGEHLYATSLATGADFSDITTG